MGRESLEDFGQSTTNLGKARRQKAIGRARGLGLPGWNKRPAGKEDGFSFQGVIWHGLKSGAYMEYVSIFDPRQSAVWGEKTPP